MKIVRPDTVAIQLSSGQTFAGAPAPTGSRRATDIGWLKAGETRTMSWTVRGAGTVTVSIASTRGGVDSRTLTVR